MPCSYLLFNQFRCCCKPDASVVQRSNAPCILNVSEWEWLENKIENLCVGDWPNECNAHNTNNNNSIPIKRWTFGKTISIQRICTSIPSHDYMISFDAPDGLCDQHTCDTINQFRGCTVPTAAQAKNCSLLHSNEERSQLRWIQFHWWEAMMREQCRDKGIQW